MCDCGGDRAPAPKIRDIGILASLDPVAIDKACYDLIAKENTEGSKEWLKQVEDRMGLNTLTVAEEIGMGSQDYNFINLDDTSNNNNKKNTLLYVLLGVGGAIIIAVVIIVVVVVYRKKKQSKLEMPEQEGLVRDNEA